MRDEELEVIRQLRASQDKYAYFLLAISASAIAFAIQKTTDKVLEWSMIPLGLAVICWGYSFYCGCMHIRYVNTSLYANAEYLQIKLGKSKYTKDQIPYAVEEISKAMYHNVNKGNKYGHNQFNFIITGAIFFIIWHITLMIIQTCFNNACA